MQENELMKRRSVTFELRCRLVPPGVEGGDCRLSPTVVCLPRSRSSLTNTRRTSQAAVMASETVENRPFAFIVQLFVIHLVCSLMSAMVQNVTQSLNEFESYTFQLMHCLYTFVFCLLWQAWSKQRFTLLPVRQIMQVSVLRFFASLAISHLLSGTLDVYRYMVRPADFIMTILIMRIGPMLLGKTKRTKEDKLYIVREAVIAITASMSYLYPLDRQFYNLSFFCYLSLGLVCGSFYFIFCQQKFRQLKADFNTYAMNVTGWSTALLTIYTVCVKAVQHRNTGLLEEVSFETIDYVSATFVPFRGLT
ncbi:unnamed protein product [Soboliphyme baturini]|uniref:Cas1_AcylT domain-containing protein n=1 Tax=Soboliphyme baturini TaxID=241478 RepID=A0A183I9U4_9BILA|nr:unnamed protein product [Soboliphyme baturini]